MTTSQSPSDEVQNPDDTLQLARELLQRSVQSLRAISNLVRAELRLARASALAVIWLGLALVILAVGAWLALIALVVAAFHAWTGSIFIATTMVFVVQVGGMLWLHSALRRCWRDLAMPRTRHLLKPRRSSAGLGEAPEGEA